MKRMKTLLGPDASSVGIPSDTSSSSPLEEAEDRGDIPGRKVMSSHLS